MSLATVIGTEKTTTVAISFQKFAAGLSSGQALGSSVRARPFGHRLPARAHLVTVYVGRLSARTASRTDPEYARGAGRSVAC